MRLQRYQRVPLLALNIFCGLLPSAAFFAWVERGCALPYLALQWGWPWISLLDQSLSLRAAWNLALFLLFGLIHSLTAQKPFHRLLESLFPPQASRSLYLAICGASVTTMMGLWQSTGIILWQAPLSRDTQMVVSMVLFYAFCSGPLLIMQLFDGLEFLGLKQLYQDSETVLRPPTGLKLQTTGIYARVRHPIYLFTFLAFLVTPVMTLDRMLLVVGSALYLLWGIPLEERKLIALFGDAYREYRTRVPALIPSISFSNPQTPSKIKT